MLAMLKADEVFDVRIRIQPAETTSGTYTEISRQEKQLTTRFDCELEIKFIELCDGWK